MTTTEQNEASSAAEVERQQWQAPARTARGGGLAMAPMSAAGETAGAAQAAKQAAIVQAMHVLALGNPRNMADVRQAMLHECRRPSFADTARYDIPNRGRGFTIRFAEMALRAHGNLFADSLTVFDDADKQVIHVFAIDLENLTMFGHDITVAKTIERSSRRSAEDVERRNSNGKSVFIVRATEEEFFGKVGSYRSRGLRECILRQVAGDLLDECLAQVTKTQRTRDAADPDAARKQLADAFASRNVMPSDLEEFLGHAYDRCTPAEITRLRGVFASLSDGEVSWQDVLDEELTRRSAKSPAMGADPLREKMGMPGKPTESKPAATEQPSQKTLMPESRKPD